MDVEGLCGRELDALVAECLFGFEVQRQTDRSTGDLDAFYNSMPRAPSPRWVRVPEYSRCVVASMNVEKKLEEWGWRRHSPPPGWRPGPPHVITMVLEHSDRRRAEALGSFETALCRAALKAITME